MALLLIRYNKKPIGLCVFYELYRIAVVITANIVRNVKSITYHGLKGAIKCADILIQPWYKHCSQFYDIILLHWPVKDA